MTYDELNDASPGVIDALPIAVLANLQSEADRHLAAAQQMQAILHAAFVRRYAAGLNDTGTHHRQDGDFDIKITVPKNVTWDQTVLAHAITEIKGWESDPADYIETKLSVAESKWNAWPAEIRRVFEGGRTVKPGKPKFEIQLREKEAA